MDSQHSPLFNWPYFFQGKSTEELTQSLLVTTLELETTRVRAQEELKMRDDQLNQLKDLLNKAITERNEAQDNFQKLFLEKIMLQQQYLQTAPHSGVSSIEDDPKIIGLDSNNGFSSSDCEESIVSSPIIDPIPPLTKDHEFILLPEKPLPEKGKFLQAVMKAGPLLQTLLLAGPLPQWRHPPPPLATHQIPPPPVAIPSPQPQLLHQDSFLNVGAFSNNNINNNCGRLNRKRGLCEGSDSSTDAKYQRVVLN